MTRRGGVVALLMLLASTSYASECVIVLHGLARSNASMEKMHEALLDAGLDAVNVDYPSREMTVEELAPVAVGEGLEYCRLLSGTETIHFVTHSLGGILVRQYLSEQTIPELGRVVMLAPPNQGSVAADKLHDVPGYDWIHGPIGRQLGKGEAACR